MKLDDLKQPESNEMCGNEWNISLPRTRIHTLEELLEYCKVDLVLWEVEKFICNKWESSSKNEDGDAVVTPLFQIKANLKKRVEIADARKEIEDLKALAFEFAPLPPPVIRPANDSGNMLELNIPDAHFGKLAWAVETAGPNYDTKIAEELFLEAAETLLARVSHFTFEQIVLVLGNDLLNSDDQEGRTTKGTYVSTDTRYQKTFAVVRNVCIRLLERLRQIAPVSVIMVKGNHDALSVWHLGDSLECYFRNYADIAIDNSPRARKYHQFGKVMLMLTHGDKGKANDYPLTMATEEPEMFGATKFRECHTGHRHKTKLDEQHGIKVRILPALCPADAWHSENMFVGNLRSAEAYVWNRDEGLLAIAIYTKKDVAGG